MNIIYKDHKNNRILGGEPTLKDSSLNFIGSNNILFCEENVILDKSILNFKGDNSLIYLGTGTHKIIADLYNSVVLHIGKHNVFTKTTHLILSEHKHCFIGNHCLISLNVYIRNADPHLIYDCETKERINPSKSVYIGDHVWLGQDVTLLKNTQIDSGSIIGAGSVVAGKKIAHNTSYAGNPCKLIKSNIFWESKSVHTFTQEMTETSKQYTEYLKKYKQNCHADYWIFNYSKEESIPWDTLEQKLSDGTPEEKCHYLIALNKKITKNRFVHL